MYGSWVIWIHNRQSWQRRKKKKSFALPQPEDGALEIGPSGGAYGTYVDLEGATKNEQELIKKYREIATYP